MTNRALTRALARLSRPAGGSHVHAMVMMPGPYEIPNVKVDAYLCYTNHPYGGAMRGFGAPQVHVAHEQAMDELAEMLGMDPLDLRKNQWLQGGVHHGHGSGPGPERGTAGHAGGLCKDLRLGASIPRNGIRGPREDQTARRGDRPGVVSDERRGKQRRLRRQCLRARGRFGDLVYRHHGNGTGRLHGSSSDLRGSARGLAGRRSIGPTGHGHGPRIGAYGREPIYHPHGKRHHPGRESGEGVHHGDGRPDAPGAGGTARGQRTGSSTTGRTLPGPCRSGRWPPGA